VLLNNVSDINSGGSYNSFQKVLVAGLSKDLTDYVKAHHLEQLIQNECRCYQLDQEAKLQIQFAIPSIKMKALSFKRRQIQVAKKKLNAILAKIKQRVDHHDETLQFYYAVDSSLKKLEDAELQIEVDLASQHLPKIEYTKIGYLLKNVLMARMERQKTLNALEKQNNFSVEVQAGAQQSLSNRTNQQVQPYFALYLRYNLGSIPSNHKVDHSLQRYMNWQNKQVLGTQKSLSNLMTTVRKLKGVEEGRLTRLVEHYRKYDAVIKKMEAINSIKAAHFKRQLTVDRILMKIEIDYLKHIIVLLRGVM
jgi:hypothetical protein